jgi:hypothetical protein
MGIKFVSLALVWFGVLELLSTLQIIRPLDSSVILPVLVVVLGLSLKHYKHSMTCLMGGACDACGRDHKCKGDNCNVCK